MCLFDNNIDELLENTESKEEYISICENHIKKIDNTICLKKNKLKIKYLQKIRAKLCSTCFDEIKNNDLFSKEKCEFLSKEKCKLHSSINSSSKKLFKQKSSITPEKTDQIIDVTERLVKLYKKQNDNYSCGKLYEDIIFYTDNKETMLHYLIKSSYYYKKIKSKFFYKICIYSIVDILQEKKDYETMSIFFEELYEKCPNEHTIKLILISSRLHSNLLYLKNINKYQFNKDYPKNFIVMTDKLEIIKNVHYNKWTNFF